MTLSAASLAVLVFLAGPPAPASRPDGGGAASLTIVVNDGGTVVHNKGDTWVSVTRNDGSKTNIVSPHTKADFSTTDAQAAKGLPAPSLVSPADRAAIRFKPTTDKGLGPVVLTWMPVAGAREYEVEFQADGKVVLLKVQRSEAKLPLLPQGKVVWAVRSVGEGVQSDMSAKRWFELQPDQLKLDVKPSGWK